MIRAGKIAMYPTAEAGEALLLVGHDGIHLNQLDKRNKKICTVYDSHFTIGFLFSRQCTG